MVKANIKIPDSILNRDDLNITEKVIYAIINQRAVWCAGTCFDTDGEIGELIGKTAKEINEIVGKLVKADCIKIISKQSGRELVPLIK